MAYTKFNNPWHNANNALGGGDVSTPVTAAALDWMEAGIAAAVASPASIASGEVPVWNGSAWVRSSVTTIGASSLGTTWTAYTPPWTASITNPVLGNGGSVGSYTQIGKNVHFRILITMGTTTTYGSGWYQLWCPISPAVGATSFAVGNGYLYDASLAVQYPLMGKLEGSGILSLWNTDTSNALVTNTTPFTFATSDIITLSGTYEAA